EENLIDGTTLYRSYKGKASTTKGFLDDYAFTIQAYLNLYEVTFNEDYLSRAKSLMNRTMEDYYDEEEKYFYYTPHDGESLISRKKEIFDNVIPSSNSAMARNLMRLGLIYDERDWLALSESMTNSLSTLVRSEPEYMCNWGIALLENKKSTAEVVFVGNTSDTLRKQFQSGFHPFSISLGATTVPTDGTTQLPLLEGKTTIDGQSTIYVCFNKSCKLPVHTVEEAVEQMLEQNQSQSESESGEQYKPPLGVPCLLARHIRRTSWENPIKKKTASNPEAAFYSTKLSYLSYTNPRAGDDKFYCYGKLKKISNAARRQPTGRAKRHFLA